MRIEHIAIWTNNLERLKDFYVKYFHATCGEKYFNAKKNFSSYFLSFESGSRLELMQMSGIQDFMNGTRNKFTGLVHFAISTGSKEAVITLTEKLRHDGFEVMGEPRTTGDGYYESVVLDPDGNRLEITI